MTKGMTEQRIMRECSLSNHLLSCQIYSDKDAINL